MPNQYAFSFGECLVYVTPAGGSETLVGYAEDLTISRRPELLEDGSTVYYIDTISITSPWVDSDVETFWKNRGPFPKVFAYWTNEDDARLVSAGVQEARLLSARHEGSEIRRFTFEFEGYSLA